MNCCNAFGTCHQGTHCPARQQATANTTPPAGPNPFAVGELPAELSADDEEDEMGQMLVQLFITYACIFVVAFAAGFAAGSL